MQQGLPHVGHWQYISWQKPLTTHWQPSPAGNRWFQWHWAPWIMMEVFYVNPPKNSKICGLDILIFQRELRIFHSNTRPGSWATTIASTLIPQLFRRNILAFAVKTSWENFAMLGTGSRTEHYSETNPFLCHSSSNNTGSKILLIGKTLRLKTFQLHLGFL